MLKLCASAAVLSMLSLAGCHHNNPPPLAYEAPSTAVGRLGYDALALPSSAYGPGSLVTSVKGTGFVPPLKLTYLCSPRYTIAPPVIVDSAASAEASRSFSGKFNLDVQALNDLGLSTSANYIRSASLTFSNVKVEQLGFDDMEEIRDSLGPRCRRYVKEYSKKGLAYQAKQGIRADVMYSVTFKAGVSASVKNAILEKLNGALGGSVDSDSGATVSGSGLYYGLILHKV